MKKMGLGRKGENESDSPHSRQSVNGDVLRVGAYQSSHLVSADLKAF